MRKSNYSPFLQRKPNETYNTEPQVENIPLNQILYSSHFRMSHSAQTYSTAPVERLFTTRPNGCFESSMI